ncbi:MAG: DUF5110 domain-containing protein, partial [Microcystaceae cyanobacterium]
WSGDRYEGPTHILARAPLEKMPLYVKAGAILPLQPVMQYVDESVPDSLTLRIYPGQGEWTLYEDDGHTFEYQKGIWATTTYRVHQDDSQVIVKIESRQGQWSPPPRQIVIEVVGSEKQQFQDDGTIRQLIYELR